MKHRRLILIALVVLVPLSVVLASGIGAVSISPGEWFAIVAHHIAPDGPSVADPQKDAVLWAIRLPRVLMSALVGASLAISGTAMQGLFRNPLADPSIIGISAGAALSAAIVIVLAASISYSWYNFPGLSTLSLATFAGAVLTSILIFRIAREKRKTNVATMLLAGIAITALAGSFTGLLTYVADEAQLRSLTFWTLGSMGGSTWMSTGITLVATAIGVFGLLTLSKPLNALTLGEQEAKHIGIPVEKLKTLVLALTALLVGCSVAFCGMIGFVGLVVPHILRLLGGPDHRFLLPASALGGALLLSWADTVSRIIAAPAEIPIGIITALVGAPVFLFLLFKQKSRMAL